MGGERGNNLPVLIGVRSVVLSLFVAIDIVYLCVKLCEER